MSTNPARALRERLARGEQVLLAGAHNGLSARLVERAGFDGVWASGFEISTARGVPDANILTMAEALEAARQMADAVSIPVIADCDNGFGNAINCIRTTQEYEKAGVAGICIEDNVFPKRCSFYEGSRRELVSIAEHAGKIQACLAARRSPDFLVIARTEAFIAGWGLEEALRRGRAYADAGADLVLVHSKQSTPEELAAFARAWDRPVPLVAVPTKYAHTRAEELDALGYKMVIFANHAIRSAIKAMRETLAVLREQRYCAAVDDRVVPLGEVYELVGLSRMEEEERTFVPGASEVRAIILAAGFDRALMPIVAERPKCMLDVKGRTILARQLETLRACGIQDIAVVRGYRKEQVRPPGVRLYDNDAWEETGEAFSLFAAAEALHGRVLVLYGDVLFEPEVLHKLLRTEAPVAVAVDRSFASEPARRLSASKPDLVILEEAARATAGRYLTLDRPPRLERIGHELAAPEADGEFIGLALFGPEVTARLRQLAAELAAAPEAPFGEAPAARRAALTDLIQHLIEQGEMVVSADVRGGWLDVDSFEDYRRVWERTVR